MAAGSSSTSLSSLSLFAAGLAGAEDAAGFLSTMASRLLCSRSRAAATAAPNPVSDRSGNAMDYIVGIEIYDHLEKVMDRFEDVANRISGIVIEQV